MKRRTLVMALTLSSAVPGVARAASKAESQAEVRKAAQDALAAVYKVAPSATKAVESAAGYAACHADADAQARARRSATAVHSHQAARSRHEVSDHARRGHPDEPRQNEAVVDHVLADARRA